MSDLLLDCLDKQILIISHAEATLNFKNFLGKHTPLPSSKALAKIGEECLVSTVRGYASSSTTFSVQFTEIHKLNS